MLVSIAEQLVKIYDDYIARNAAAIHTSLLMKNGESILIEKLNKLRTFEEVALENATFN